ncbi:HAD family hydrolase [Leadbettera azotonutricia]|uniref:HAD family hydrolase n=1 Tax=Leadbettera azotonutricia TaxID=150829 RepID=UPI0011D27A7D|nr:HAD-IA family hydrolase [Leadbettera azotonutricia]
MTQGVIFDMDGVLTDSEWFIAEAGKIMFRENHNTAVTHEDFLPFVGMGENRFLGGVAEKYRLNGFDIERDKKRTYEIYVEIIKGKLDPLPGAVEFVKACIAAGYKTALATSTDYIKMNASLEAIGLAHGFFEATVNGLEVERRKPFPDIFLEAARRIGIAPDHCWVVEDSVGGVQAAKAAGMRCLGLLTTFPEGEIRKAGADIIVKDLSAVRVEEIG